MKYKALIACLLLASCKSGAPDTTSVEPAGQAIGMDKVEALQGQPLKVALKKLGKPTTRFTSEKTKVTVYIWEKSLLGKEDTKNFFTPEVKAQCGSPTRYYLTSCAFDSINRCRIHVAADKKNVIVEAHYAGGDDACKSYGAMLSK